MSRETYLDQITQSALEKEKKLEESCPDESFFPRMSEVIKLQEKMILERGAAYTAACKFMAEHTNYDCPCDVMSVSSDHCGTECSMTANSAKCWELYFQDKLPTERTES